MQVNLPEIFMKLCFKYSDNHQLIMAYWKEIEISYSQKNRHYHNLSHLESMIIELNKTYNKIEDFDSILFSVFYHDIVYKSTSKDNEEKSAITSKNRLQKFELNETKLNKIFQQILDTKSHRISDESDNNYLLDADLSILGKSWKHYEIYLKQIRREYSIYPNIIYNPGRKNVLEHFLAFDNIYKTIYFQDAYEKQARENISKEIKLL